MKYRQILEACWKGYRRVPGTKANTPGSCEKISEQELEEDLRKWFKEKWVRFGPDGKIRGPCARGSKGEGKPKCLPQKKAHSLGKKKRASAAAKKRREDPNPERKGKAKNVATKTLKESMSFTPVRSKKDPKSGRTVLSSNDFGSVRPEECWVCDGTGKDSHYDSQCGMCNGKGKIEEFVLDAPELNVSNSNGLDILKMLGIGDPDYVGHISNKELPDIMRKLIMLKNKGIEQYTKPTTQSGGERTRYKDPETGLDKIGKSATMIDVGRTSEQVENYVDKLIKLVKFAQENNADIGWS